MLREGKIWVGAGPGGPVCLLPAMANRHGLIAGATGTGKTVTLKLLAEGFSDLGVPVFLSDIKSDLSGMVQAGAGSEKINSRLELCGVNPDDFEYKAYPTVFWDVYGEQGHPIRATVQGMGALLLSRMLGLNETQTGVMNILFRIANEKGYALEDIRDLKAMLVHLGENAKEYTLHYGNVSTASVGAIQRAVAMLEDQGGDLFFGRPDVDIQDWLHVDPVSGQGRINVLSADKLFNNPTMYSTFMLWMLTELYDLLPEVGDLEKPRIVFFFDEAHLLFNNCGRSLMEKIEQVVRLIRSKGVGVYFITQSPADIPMAILGQLGNRVQHALRAYTPLDQKAVKVAAQTFRTNPSFDTEEAITTLKTGEALLSFLDEHGAPGVVERATILPPQSHMGAISESDRARVISTSPIGDKYDKAIPGVGAYMNLNPPQYIVMQPMAAPQVSPFPVSSTTPLAAQVSTAQQTMATFKVFDPTTGQYVEKQMDNMNVPEQPAQPAQPVYDAVAPVVQQVQPYVQQAVDAVQPVMQQAAQAAQPVIQQVQPYVQQAADTVQPIVQQVHEAVQPVVQTVQPVVQQAQEVVQPIVQPLQGIVQPTQTVPTIQVQPQVQQVQQMPVMVLDPTTGQYVQQMMNMVLDPTTGNYIPAPVAVDPKALAEQQKAAEKARKEAEKAAKEAARVAKEEEAAARRARTDQLREEAAERARRNDSVAGRIKNTAINTATRQIVSDLTKGIGKAVSGLFGDNNKR